MTYEEFQGCLDWWHDRQENEFAWKVNGPGLIQKDEDDRVIACNLDVKNPHAKEAEDHRKPSEIVDAIIRREQEILSIMDELRSEFAGNA